MWVTPPPTSERVQGRHMASAAFSWPVSFPHPLLCSRPGHEDSTGHYSVIGDYIPLSGAKLEPPCVKPSFLLRSSSPRCRFESEVSST